MTDLKINIEKVTSFLSSIAFKFPVGIVEDCIDLFADLENYVDNQHATYTKEVGLLWITNLKRSHIKLRNDQIRNNLCNACVSMLDQAYKKNYVNNIPLSRVTLKESFKQEIEIFLREADSNGLGEAYQKNAQSHCYLFAAYLQYQGISSFSELSYPIVRAYIENVLCPRQTFSKNWSHDTFIYSLLRCLSDKNIISCGFPYFFHYYGDPFFVDPSYVNVFTGKTESDNTEVPINALKGIINTVIDKLVDLQYSPCMIEHIRRALNLLICSLDIAGLNYTERYADLWLQAFKKKTDSSSYKMAERAISILKDMVSKGTFQPGYTAAAPRELAPEWAGKVLDDFLQEKKKLKLGKSAFTMFRVSNVRFLQKINEMGIHDYKGAFRFAPVF